MTKVFKKQLGMVRAIDRLGRIVLPKELRQVLNLPEGAPVEIFVQDEEQRIILRKYQTLACFICQSVDDLLLFHNKHICTSCLKQMIDEEQTAPLKKAEPVMHTIPLTPRRSNRKVQDTLRELKIIMQDYPDVTKSEWARLLDVSPGRLSQLLKLMREQEQEGKQEGEQEQ